jgi:hypothetical protein
LSTVHFTRFYFSFIELEASKKQTEADKKIIDDLVRERDILNKVSWYYYTFQTCLFKVVYARNGD